MDLNKHNVHVIIGLILLTLILWSGLQNFTSIMGIISGLIGIIFPFILGSCMAFVINIPMAIFERHLFKEERIKDKPFLKKIKRPVSLVLAVLAIILLLCIISFLIVPEFGESLMLIKNRGPGFIRGIQDGINNLQVSFPAIADFLKNLSIDWASIEANIMGFVQKSALNFLDSTVSTATSIVGGVINFFVGIIFAFYVLLQKEKLGRQFRKVLYSYFPERVCDRILYISNLASTNFANFVSGQCTEAVVIGIVFFIVMTIFRFPYALMISVLIGFLSLIPVFGAFIACTLGAFLILMGGSFMRAVWFVIMFLIVQQIDGNLIYPNIMGGSIGLPSIWVLVAVTIGGKSWGIVGMIITIPICSVLYVLLQEAVAERLKERNISKEKIEEHSKKRLSKER